MRSQLAQAADGDAEVPREIEIGHIKAGPREVDATVGHGTDRSRNALIIVRSSIAFNRRFDAPAAAALGERAGKER